jgi:hypothetical protein
MENLFTLKEMADLLKVPLSWLYSRTRLKGPDAIPHLRVGKYCRFDPEAVLAWTRKTYQKDTGQGIS